MLFGKIFYMIHRTISVRFLRDTIRNIVNPSILGFAAEEIFFNFVNRRKLKLPAVYKSSAQADSYMNRVSQETQVKLNLLFPVVFINSLLQIHSGIRL